MFGLKRLLTVPFGNTDPKLDRYLKKAIKNKNFRASNDNSEFKDAEIIVVDIHLDIPFKNNVPKLELDGFKKAIYTIGNHIREDCLVIIETTVPPGTCSKVVLPILKECFTNRGLNPEKVKLAHSYERVMPGEEYYDSIINFWVDHNSLTDLVVDTFPNLNNNNKITISQKYSASNTNNEVWLYTHESGHNWGDDGDIVIEEEIWLFFSRMSLSQSTFIEETYQSSRLIKVVDILGRNSTEKQNCLLFYIYDDGTVEKKIIVE